MQTFSFDLAEKHAHWSHEWKPSISGLSNHDHDWDENVKNIPYSTVKNSSFARFHVRFSFLHLS